MSKYTPEQQFKIQENARKYGGNFTEALLGHAYVKADLGNKRRIEEAFSEMIEKYLKFENK